MTGARSSYPEAAPRLTWRKVGPFEWLMVGTHYRVVAFASARSGNVTYRVEAAGKWLATWIDRCGSHRERARSWRSREAAMRAAEIDYADTMHVPAIGGVAHA